MEYVYLYTRQHRNSLEELKNSGYFFNREKYIKLHMGDLADSFLMKYRYFVKMAENIVPRSQGCEFPIWCSISEKNCLKPIQDTIVYCLKVPKENVIYFDGGKWDYVLNNLYIAQDEEDEKNYRIELEKRGIKDVYRFIEGKYAGWYPDIEAKIVKSWERIFDIQDWNEFVVQANLWEIRKEWVLHIVKPGENFFKIIKKQG